MTEERLAELREICEYGGNEFVLTQAMEEAMAEIDQLREKLAHYRWRPISEIHEDLGSCVLIRIDDPGYMEIGSNLDEDFNESGFTHFAEVPKLTNEEAETLAQPAEKETI